jgi:mono/diheme cytochrome c family protein
MKRAHGLGLALAACAALAVAPGARTAEETRSATEPRSVDGQQIFVRWCVPCHGAGPGHPGTQALAVKYHGNPPAVLEERSDLTAEVVRYYVRHGISVMAPFRKTEISDEELDALASWLGRLHATAPATP